MARVCKQCSACREDTARERDCTRVNSPPQVLVEPPLPADAESDGVAGFVDFTVGAADLVLLRLHVE